VVGRDGGAAGPRSAGEAGPGVDRGRGSTAGDSGADVPGGGLASENQALRAENQQLRDELKRLQGGSGRPKLPPGKAGGSNYSSERERRPAPKTWQKRGKQDRLRIDRTERVVVDPATRPSDAVFKGYETVVVQDLVLRTDTVAFEQEI
jgi:hypothetical protein